MTKDQKDRLSIEAKKFRDTVKEIVSDDDYDDFSYEFFQFITDFSFDHQETTSGSKK